MMSEAAEAIAKSRQAGRIVALPLAWLLASAAIADVCAQSQLPHLRRQGTATQLIVDGSPFLVLGGEIGNSSASSLDYMGTIWPKLAAMQLNTVLVPVYWDLIEPKQGVFDFTLTDGVIRAARQHRMRLVLLWFGSWKNSMSSYAPAWIKTDQTRYPRARSREGVGLEILSPFSVSNRDADARAFRALMRHVRAVDARDRTVIMVQVENEIGMIPAARDYSARADSLYAQSVPAELLNYLQAHRDSLTPELSDRWARQGHRTSGTWEDVFGVGPATEELFMAWHFARYVQHVAEAGKAEYALPMYVNAALIRPGYAPGGYPSAGPLPHLFDIWRAAAPAIDFFAPDIYFANFIEWTTKYHRSGNPLFVPEANRAGAPEALANVLYAIGAHDAIGFSPFSIESVTSPKDDMLARGYAALAELAPLILAHHGRGTMAGVRPRVVHRRVGRYRAECVARGLRAQGVVSRPMDCRAEPRRAWRAHHCPCR